MSIKYLNRLVLAFAFALPGVAQAADRDVQITAIHFDAGLIELHNFGISNVPLDGWIFCTHDENQVFQYTSGLALNGFVIEAGTSFFVHFNNDAPGGANSINRSSLGLFATPLDAGVGAYSISLYVNSLFSIGTNIADHLQWSLGGVDNVFADERSDEAQSGGVWTNQSVWISTTSDTRIIKLTDNSGATLHGPANYEVIDAIANPIPQVISNGAVTVRLETIATGLTAPNWGTSAPGDNSNLYVTDQSGILWKINTATGTKSVFLDVSDQLVPLGVFGPDSFDERGLLGVAFHPNYQTNGFLYTYTSFPVNGAGDFTTMPGGIGADHQSVITRWTVIDPSLPNAVVSPISATELLRIDEPQFNHNAGALNFGPDGMLYISLGDGGGADDKDGQVFFGALLIGHGSDGNGSNAENILGTVLRIDPDGSNSANGAYGIPVDNPFVGAGDTRLDEIFAYGFRNPFRFSFDQLTGELYVADVGQNHIEEINLVTSGGNHGWNVKEGTFAFEPNDIADGFVTSKTIIGPFADPIAQYDHDEGIAIVGGFVYRGTKIPPLVGRYVFGDFARSFSNDGRLFYLDETNEIKEFNLFGQAGLGLSLLGFGQDANGEIYVMASANGIPFGTTGVMLRLNTKLGDLDANGIVSVADLLTLLTTWGQSNVPADIDMSGSVNVADLLILLVNWG